MTSHDSARPIARLTVALLGGVLLGAVRPGRAGRTALRLFGLGVIALAAQPLLEASVRRAGQRRRSVSFRSIIDVERPIAEVFAFFKDFENFPRVIGGIHSVIDYQDGRSRWEAFTPSGRRITWDVVVTKYMPNAVIGWGSVRGSIIDTSGVIRFKSLSPRWTRLDIGITYRPLRTDLDDAVHALLAPRAGKQLHADLEHARFYLESLPTVESAPQQV